MATDIVQVAATKKQLEKWHSTTSGALQLYYANSYSTNQKNKYMNILFHAIAMQATAVQISIQKDTICSAMKNPKIFSRGIVTRLQRNTRLPEAKVTDGCKHPCSILLRRYVFSISLPHPCHNIGPLIYDDCAVCCIHCGPARGPSPLSDALILYVCDHCSRGTRLCDCDPCENHSGHRARVSSPPLALRKPNLCCLVFPSQKFLA